MGRTLRVEWGKNKDGTVRASAQLERAAHARSARAQRDRQSDGAYDDVHFLGRARACSASLSHLTAATAQPRPAGYAHHTGRRQGRLPRHEPRRLNRRCARPRAALPRPRRSREWDQVDSVCLRAGAFSAHTCGRGAFARARILALSRSLAHVFSPALSLALTPSRWLLCVCPCASRRPSLRGQPAHGGDQRGDDAALCRIQPNRRARDATRRNASEAPHAHTRALARARMRTRKTQDACVYVRERWNERGTIG
jgi:hypothetical protein